MIEITKVIDKANFIKSCRKRTGLSFRETALGCAAKIKGWISCNTPMEIADAML